MIIVDLPLGQSYTPSSIVRLEVVLLKLDVIFALWESKHRVLRRILIFFERGGQ